MNVFARKATALKYLKDDMILCNDNITKYFILKQWSDFKNLIESKKTPNYYEFINDKNPFNFFMDIEIFKDKNLDEYNNHESIIKSISDEIESFVGTLYKDIIVKKIILESHLENIKRSYHIIFRIYNGDQAIYFKNIRGFKRITSNLFSELVEKKIIDTSVYREGLFRTYLSSKGDEIRPLVKSNLSSDFDFLETFVGYVPNIEMQLIIDTGSIKINKKKKSLIKNKSKNKEDNEEINQDDNDNNDKDIVFPVQDRLSQEDINIIKQFIRKYYRTKSQDVRDIIIDKRLNCIIVALDDTYCYNIDREHKTNHQYIVIDTYSAKQKCHDMDCQNYKHNEIKIKEIPKELNEIILKCLRVNKTEQELIQKAIEECKSYIVENFDRGSPNIQFDKNEMIFKGDVTKETALKMIGKCPECHVEHHISDNGYCLRCKICKSIFPKNTLIPIDDKYKHLNSFFMNYNQLVNNGTVNINIQNNYYNNNEEEFSCDVELDNSIFRNKELTKLYNQVLDGHKVVKISELLHKLEIDFKYTNGMWYYFNGSIWRSDKESLELRKRIVKLSNHFNRIKAYYENKDTETSNILVKNIKSLSNKLYKPGFEEEIIKGAKMYYNDETFISKLNSKKHLLPFSNGVYDLLENKFRETKKEDYINLTVNYNYNPDKINKEVYIFLEQVIPNKDVRDYVLKKMSECLNGDIPNTHFLMFIGDTGANGKSQLLNLMKLAMGEFGEKVEVTLLTRKRNNANEANSEKIKLMHKRFAFLSEPEDGEKINIGLLKELTGSEEIVARGLYQEAVSFVLEAKLFLACNELPEIKGEDTALWRRIRVIDFPSRFVDDPKEHNEYKIDRTLPSRMREDISWRQTFIKILLDYYYKDIIEPKEIRIKTNEYRQENNDFYNWLEENIEYKNDEILKLTDIVSLYLGKTKIHSKESSKYKKEVEKWIKERYKNVKWEYRIITYNDKQQRGWRDLFLKDTSFY
jgi:P4 family phage/plasmid primase-like protien